MDESTQERPPISNVYHGKMTERNVKGYEEEWQGELERRSFDQILLDQLQTAHESGRNKVVVCDIGSASGVFLRDFLSHPKVGLETRAFLKDNPNMQIQMIGLTDAKGSTNQFEEKEITVHTDVIPDNSQITAKNVFYSLSINQSFQRFLDHVGIDKVDFAVSTYTLTYLPPSIFNRVVEDVTERLREKSGLFIATKWADEYLIGFTEHNPLEKYEEPSAKSYLRHFRGRLYRGVQDPQAEDRALTQAEDHYVRVHAVERGRVRKARLFDRIRRIILFRDPKESLDDRVSQTLLRGREKLFTERIEKFKKEKREMLTGLSEKYKDSAEVKFNKDVLVIKR